MSISNEALQKLLREVETQALVAQQQIALVRTQQASKSREMRMAQLTRTEMASLPADTNVYEGVGKMFLSLPVSEMKGKLEKQIKDLEGDVDGLGKRLHYLEVSQKNSKDQIDRMYPSSYSDDESDIDIRVSSSRHRRASPPRRQVPVAHYVEARAAPRPRYMDDDRYLYPSNERTVVTTRRSRSRSRDRRTSSPSGSSHSRPPPPPPPAQPVIINNHYRVSESESDSDHDHHHARSSRRRSHSRTSSGYSRERENRERDLYALQHVREDYERELELKRREYKREQEVRQKDYELERTQKELEELQLAAKIEREEKRRERTAREEHELREAKKELDALREKKEREEVERRMKQKIELDRLKEEENALAEKKRREKEAKEAVERYKKEEAERQLKEKEEKEEREREYKHRMQEQLLKSGLGEHEINAILSGKKIEKQKEKEKEKAKLTIIEDKPRPTYTRMARRHLSLETLRVYDIDYTLDTDPNYVLIKRWVPEQEQDVLWRHTRVVREQREGKLVLQIEDKKDSRRHHHHLEPEFEWVRKKERRRSKSPGLLTYLAGGRPA
ncbi:hypothetical protein F5Y16DRAFT_399349 [Xylariaceae sp. FL0255]|nr:hypothetical protein F5Y16DRAFT_399349 [Xylariaceae sp. FL0255]